MPEAEGAVAGETRLIGVVGCGTMGSGVAEAAARAGHRVMVRVLDDRHASEGRGRLSASLDRATEAGRIEPGAAAAALERISFHRGLDELASADLVVEAIPERLEEKRACSRSSLQRARTPFWPPTRRRFR